MKKLLLLITALFILASVEGQILRYSNYTAPVPPEEPSGGITDDFEAYSAGNIGGQGSWVAAINNMVVVDNSGNNEVRGQNDYDINAAYYNDTFDADQYAECVIVTVGDHGSVGVAVRVSASRGYLYYGSQTARTIMYYNSADADGYDIATAASGVSVNDVLRIEVEGTTIRCYLNGSLDTSLTGGTGTFTDTKLSTGRPGISGATAANVRLDTWEGGDL